MSMKQTMWKLPAALLLLAVMVVGLATTAQSGLFYPDPKVGVLEPAVHPQQPGPIDLVFRFAPPDSYKGDGTFTVKAISEGAVIYNGPNEWTITALSDAPYEKTISIMIMPDTVSGLAINVYGENFAFFPGAYFVHRNDSVEFWKGYPGPLPAPDDMRNKPDDTVNARLYLRTDEQRDHAIELLGSLPDSSVAVPINVRITQAEFDAVSRIGVKAINMDTQGWKRDSSQFLRDLWWLHKYRGGGRKDTTDRNEAKPTDPSGALDATRDYEWGGIVWVDTIVPMSPYGLIPATDSVEIRLHMYNGSGTNLAGSTNGFVIKSEDGATWGSLSGSWCDDVNYWYDQDFENYFSNDGQGADTVGFGGFKIFLPGIPWEWQGWTWTITMNLSDPANVGREICIDTCFYPPGGEWLWSGGDGGQYAAEWDGPTCFTVGENEVYLSGQLLYKDCSSPTPTHKPMRNVEVQIWDRDIGGDDPLGFPVTTDDDGFYTAGPFHNVDELSEGSGPLDIYLRIACKSTDVCRITSDSSTNNTYILTTGVEDNVPSGAYSLNYTDTACDNSKYFYVLDVLTDGKAFAESIPGVSMPTSSDLLVVVDVYEGLSHAGPTAGGSYRMGIQDSVSRDDFWPDTWDRSVILHEYGHILAFSHEFGDDTGSGYPLHHWYDITDARFALFEAFPQFFAGACTDSDSLLRTGGDQLRDTAFLCLETGLWGWHGVTLGDATPGTANCMGLECEGTVACALWDIIDDQSGLEEFSDSTQWGQTAPVSSGDGIGDELTVPIGDVFAVLLTTYDSTGQRPDTFEEFWKVWNKEGYGYQDQMHNIMFEHGIVWDCCRGIRGNANGSTDDIVNIQDLTYLNDYLFGGGAAPPCMTEADVNADGTTNVQDLTYLVNYVFGSGAAPIDCAGLKKVVDIDNSGPLSTVNTEK